jgi:selenide,water dikinase
MAPWQQALLSDPQTSGGLLVSCAPGSVDEVLAAFRQAGFGQAAVMGELASGVPGLNVVA